MLKLTKKSFILSLLVVNLIISSTLAKDTGLKIQVRELNKNLVVKVEYAKWYFGAPVEQRIIMQSMNNICKKDGKALTPEYTVCSSPLTGTSNCFTVCTDGNWTPPWNFISQCGDDCGQNTVIFENDKIKGDVIFKKDIVSPLFTIEGKMNSTNREIAKKKIGKFCDEYYNSSLAVFECGKSFDIEYGQCNSKYKYYNQCIALCE